MSDFQDLEQRLSAISEELADLAIERLRSSLEEDDPQAAEEERRITRARRAVEKAVALLSDGRGDPDI